MRNSHFTLSIAKGKIQSVKQFCEMKEGCSYETDKKDFMLHTFSRNDVHFRWLYKRHEHRWQTNNKA